MLLILIVLALNTFQKNKNFIGNKFIQANIFRMQACDLIMCRCFFIGFIDFMFKDNNLTNFGNLFSSND